MNRFSGCVCSNPFLSRLACAVLVLFPQISSQFHLVLSVQLASERGVAGGGGSVRTAAFSLALQEFL